MKDGSINILSDYKIESKEKIFFWNCWNYYSGKGKKYWEFILPKEFQNLNWNSKEGKVFLKKMQKAFEFDKKNNPNSSDLIYRTKHKFKPIKNKFSNFNSLQEKAENSAKLGFEFFKTLICDEGYLPADYGGPLFLLPGLIIASYITDSPFSEPKKVLMKQYILNHQNEDGGWGLHIEGKSTMFGSVLNYISLRLLGEETDNKSILKGQHWIKNKGGAISIPPWGKFYLSILNLYDWKGSNSLFPEQWIFPKWLPFHPSKYWCHSRMVYLPMSYLFGLKYQKPENDLILSLRKEIYTTSYEELNWKAYRNLCNKYDTYKPLSKTVKLFNFIVNTYEKITPKKIRKKALKFCEKYIEAEDKQSQYLNIGPVNKVLNSISIFVQKGNQSEEFNKHLHSWNKYLWLAEDGLKMNGYNGSQFWDVIFTTQALQEGNLEYQFPELTSKLSNFIVNNQIKQNHFKYNEFYRDQTIGAWPFSTKEQGWTITDCTAEGIKTMIGLNTLKLNNLTKIDFKQLEPSIDLLLYLQNKDGGWASYEKQRGIKWLEKLNTSFIFDEIMLDYSFVECTSAVIQGIMKFSQYSSYRKNHIIKAVKKGQQFILTKQNKDGSFYGSWAVCYTYGTWFALEGLKSSGAKLYSSINTDKNIKKSCEFLVSKQREDGSWGESFQSCVQKKYIEHREGQLTNTSWALLALMACEYPNKKIIEKGINYLIDSQLDNGDFPQQAISGVFNGNCMITYTSYKNVFPIWALNRYFNHYKD